MKGKSILAMLLAAGLAASMLAGCGSSAEDAAEGSAVEEISAADETEELSAEDETEEASDADETEIEDAESAVTAGETVYPITVTDSYGEEVTIESEPERVVSVAPNLTETMYFLGVEDKLVGRSDYCDYPEDVVDIDSVGSLYDPDIEAIIALEPDVVIVSTHFDDENSQKLEDVGIPVITLYDEEDVTGVYGMIETLGSVMNANDMAAQLVEQMQDTIDEVALTIAGRDEPTVYYVVDFGEYGDFTAGGDTFIGGILDLSGADNIAKDVSGWSIDTETIIEADPDIIIMSEDRVDEFMSTAPYDELTAVQEGNVYGIDTDILDRQGYRNAEGVQTIAEICYPDLFE
ncbi:MAG: ABC transporter substrate-binding protein [Clostridiales bacterium]|nr:ABC transporter substrate-binding protein [Clostridiales bacterium]